MSAAVARGHGGDVGGDPPPHPNRIPTVCEATATTCRSIEHRVTINLEKERISIAAFHTPGLEVKIGPLPEIIKEKTTKYKTIDVEDYLRLSISNKLDGKSLIEQMKIQE